MFGTCSEISIGVTQNTIREVDFGCIYLLTSGLHRVVMTAVFFRQVSSNSGKHQAKLLSSVIVRKRSKDESSSAANELDSKKSKTTEVIETTATTTTATTTTATASATSTSEQPPGPKNATGLGALAVLGGYYSDSDEASDSWFFTWLTFFSFQ